MRTIIIGDVHGMYGSLSRLIEKLNVTIYDKLVFVGDLVDKGPASAATVRLVRGLSGFCDVVVVEGNHEEKHRRYRKHVATDSGVAPTMKGADEMRSITGKLSSDDIEFMDSFVPFHKILEHNVLVVHAGITGNMIEFPATVQEARDMSAKKRKSLGKILRTRYIDADTGKFVGLGQNAPQDPFWADVYDGRFGHVVFGHEPFMDGPREFEHATGLDTGCVFGGQLTALVLEGTQREYVSVTGEKYAELYQAA